MIERETEFRDCLPFEFDGHKGVLVPHFNAQLRLYEYPRQRDGKWIYSEIYSIYTASKGAILAFTRAAALELAPYGINVNCVLPGTTKTDMSKDVIADPVVAKALIDPIPLGRLGTPEDLVGIVLYLASDEASWTTGQSFIVDGGHTMK